MRGSELLAILRRPRTTYERWRLWGKRLALFSIRAYLGSIHRFVDPEEWWHNLRVWTDQAVQNYGAKRALPLQPDRSEVIGSGARTVIRCISDEIRELDDRFPNEPERRRSCLLNDLDQALKASGRYCTM